MKDYMPGMFEGKNLELYCDAKYVETSPGSCYYSGKDTIETNVGKRIINKIDP